MNDINEFNTFFGKMKVSNECCFLCGEQLNKENKSEEHVFPKWLQHKYDLWDKKIILLNRTEFTYRNLKVYCCKKCNNEYLSEIEKNIKEALEKGFDAFKELDKNIILKWIMKIEYCLLYKESFLKMNIREKSNETIIKKDDMKMTRVLFDYMESIKNKVELNGEIGSLFIFNIINKGPKEMQFNYRDDIIHQQFMIQLGDIGIICCLNDSGLIREYFDKEFEVFTKIKLNLIQFRELVAKVWYQRILLRSIPISMMIKGETINQIRELKPLTTNYNKYNNKIFALVFANFISEFGYSFNDLYNSEYDGVYSFLLNKDNKLIIYNEDGTYKLGDICNVKRECFGEKLFEK